MKDGKDWTIMIYMAGDNNLSIDMAYALEELQQKVVINGNDKINLFVHYKNNTPEIPTIYCDFSDLNDPLYQYSTEIGNEFSAGISADISNSEATYPVINFVDWCVKRVEQTVGNKTKTARKSMNYGLIFAGHTMGFLSMGLLKDESKNVSLTMPDLQKGLEIITEKIIGKKLALLGFDSCVMGMLEVGQQFKKVAETMIASEGSIPNAGWSYAEILGSLANENKDVKEIAGEFVQKYIAKQSRYSIGGVSVDMAAWDLCKLDSLTHKFGQLAKNLLKCFEDKESSVYSQMRRVLLQVHFSCQTYLYEQNIDIGDFCSILMEELDTLKAETGGELNSVLRNVRESSRSVISEINNCIILSGFCGGEYQFSNGISLFFPWSFSAYKVSINDYENLSFVQNTDAGKIWNEFLKKYLCEISRRKAIEPAYQSSLEIKYNQNINNHSANPLHAEVI